MNRKLFGTDGIRGLANSHPMTPEIAMKAGMAAGRLFTHGDQVTIVPRYSLVMGKGNAVEHDDKLGVNFGASDPRTDGQATPEMMPF